MYPLAKVAAFSGHCPPPAHIPMSIYNARELGKKPLELLSLPPFDGVL